MVFWCLVSTNICNPKRGNIPKTTGTYVWISSIISCSPFASSEIAKSSPAISGFSKRSTSVSFLPKARKSTLPYHTMLSSIIAYSFAPCGLLCEEYTRNINKCQNRQNSHEAQGIVADTERLCQIPLELHENGILLHCGFLGMCRWAICSVDLPGERAGVDLSEIPA